MAVAVTIQALRITACGNFHELVPGLVYRSAQLTPEKLERVIQAHGIRTIVNLRGCSVALPWYDQESRTSHRTNTSQEDIAFAATRFPSISEMRRLVSVFDRAEYPILLHCRQGADRTGMAAGVYLLLQTGKTLDEARAQLNLRYGHLPIDQPTWLDHFFDVYERWLKSTHQEHSPERFRRWLSSEEPRLEHYCALEALTKPKVHLGQYSTLRVCATNLGNLTWHFRPGKSAGHHLAFVLLDAFNRTVVLERSGLFVRDIPPGESIELTVALPPLSQTGRYRLFIDMIDEQQCWFHQVGSEPLELEFSVDG